jgi:hypothetical protein
MGAAKAVLNGIEADSVKAAIMLVSVLAVVVFNLIIGTLPFIKMYK